ncbi:MAG TPA: alpha/beta hydrolase [Spirochaetia bacterium]|nr:alpha/beta hydrolase [Spirochaetia bacterium]
MKSGKIDIWQGYAYAGEGTDGFRPTLETYVLDGERPRPLVLVCPGGGYHFVSPREAEPIALQFNAAGFHSCVLDYSVAPRRHPQPLRDLSRAMCIAREHAAEWKVNADQIAVCGFSAGGHLAASLGVHWNKPYLANVPGIDVGLNRPDALILSYPVLTSGGFAHRGSFANLLGEDPSKELLEEMSLELQVTSETPPAFLWHTVNDEAVPVQNSLLFADALRRSGVPFELHLYPRGPHGISLATAETSRTPEEEDSHIGTWMTLCIEWLRMLFPTKSA